MRHLRSWHLSTLKVVSEPMSALARTSESDCRTRTTGENCTARESWTRTKYSYDANGNTTTEVVSSDTTTFAWDYENRLTSVTLPGSGGTVSFKYDPFGRRIYKSSSSATSVYAYDGDNLIEETNSSGATVARYSQGLNIDEPLAMLRASATSFYHADGLGSVTSLSNGAGALAQTYGYDSFGKQTSSSGSLINPFQYGAREFDSEDNLYYFRARHYAPDLGRFLSEDPIPGATGYSSFYSYAANNPLLYVDPSGRIIRVVGRSLQDINDYYDAVHYLRRDPCMAKVLDALAGSSTVYTVAFNSVDDDSFHPGTNTVNWDPGSALLNTGGGRQTPALGLGHEMTHADGGWIGNMLSKISSGAYGNLEEWRAIRGCECKAAKTLGEDPRWDHGGSTYRVPKPTMR